MPCRFYICIRIVCSLERYVVLDEVKFFDTLKVERFEE
jgi:hypothetical protein